MWEILSRLGREIEGDRIFIASAFKQRDPIIAVALFNRACDNIFERTFEMAKRIQESKGKERKKADFAGFANVELTLEEKAEAKQWIQELEKVNIELDEMLASHYKISVFKSEATGGYQATAFCADSQSPNSGYILSAFAPYWFDAMAMLAYKHAIKCETVWPLKDEGRGDLWG